MGLLDTEAVLRRIVLRRAKLEVGLRNNVTNFVGASREIGKLHRLFRAEQLLECSSDGSGQ